MPNSPISLPARIGKYELQEFLGGGMSHVYRAEDTVLRRAVALKILTPESSANPDAKARFLREARLASNIMHDHIIRVYDFGEENERPYMVMEFLQGQDLRHAINGNALGDMVSKLRIAIDIAGALDHIHTQKIVHRDVKPDNIHMDTTGKIRLMDFGIAKTAEYSLTRPGFTLGTPFYMAPEQVMGKQVTESVDLYAFGIMLYEILTGSKPFQAETVPEIFTKVLKDPVDLAPLEQIGAPRRVIELIHSLTQKDPAGRVGDFLTVMGELNAGLSELLPSTGQTGTHRSMGSTTTGSRTAMPPKPSFPNTRPAAGKTQPQTADWASVLKGPWLIAAVVLAVILIYLIVDLIVRG